MGAFGRCRWLGRIRCCGRIACAGCGDKTHLAAQRVNQIGQQGAEGAGGQDDIGVELVCDIISCESVAFTLSCLLSRGMLNYKLSNFSCDERPANNYFFIKIEF